jgi:hypothetical protein
MGAGCGRERGTANKSLRSWIPALAVFVAVSTKFSEGRKSESEKKR